MDRGIPALIRLRRWTVDEERRKLAVLQEEEARLAELAERLEAEILKERKVAEDDPAGPGGRAFGAFIAAAATERTRLSAERAKLARIIEVQRDSLAEAFRDLKTLEQLQKNRARRAAQEAARREQAVLDEIAQTGFQRRRARG